MLKKRRLEMILSLAALLAFSHSAALADVLCVKSRQKVSPKGVVNLSRVLTVEAGSCPRGFVAVAINVFSAAGVARAGGATGAAAAAAAAAAAGAAGPAGAAGAPGAPGAAGPAGAAGTTGATGVSGAAGATGITGATGATGSIVSTLPSGQTLRGTWGGFFTATAPNQYLTDTQIFAASLLNQTTAHFIAAGATPPAECPGSAAGPEAAAGHLCVYEIGTGNRTFVNIFDTSTGAGKMVSSKYGFTIYSQSIVAGTAISYGTYAVQAP